MSEHDEPLNIEEAALAAETCSTLNGMTFEGNNYKLTKWFSLPTHLKAALRHIAQLEERVVPPEVSMNADGTVTLIAADGSTKTYDFIDDDSAWKEVL